MSPTSTRTRKVNRGIRPVATWLRATRLGAIALRSVVFGSIAIIVSGFGHALFHPVRDESTEAAGVVAAIVNHETGSAADLAALREGLGYQPLAERGQLLNPTGSCSTPLPIGPEEFEEACRTHDLGYDLLRVAEIDGGRLGAWARFDLDRHLYSELLARCETIRCRAMATAYYTAVTTNSIRQGYKAPTEEPATPWIGLGLMVLGLAVITEPRGPIRDLAHSLVGMGAVTLGRPIRIEARMAGRQADRRGISIWRARENWLQPNSSHRRTLRGTV